MFRMIRSGLLCLTAVCAWSAAEGQTATMELSSTTGAVGATATATVTISGDLPITGFSVGVVHDPALTLDQAPGLGPALTGLPTGSPAYAEVHLATSASGEPGFTAGVVLDFNLSNTLAPGTSHTVLEMQYGLGAGVVNGGTYALTFSEQLAPQVGAETGAPVPNMIVELGPAVETVAASLTLVEGSITASQVSLVRGDATDDGQVNIADAVRILDALFNQTAPPLACPGSGDMNDDGLLNIADPIQLLTALFVSGTWDIIPPPNPSTGCGVDEDLPCDAAAICAP
ncbi:MAG: dockerin type I repeat-containing protein [Planctomycetota bacterium]